MTGDAAGEHTYTTAWLKYVAPVVLGTVAIIGLQVYWWATGTTAPGSWWIPVAALVLTVAYLWAVPRRMVRRAVLDDRCLRVTTLTGSRDIALTELTGIAWNAAGGGAAGPMNLFGMVSARIRHRGGELLVPMPDGADLLRELEGVRPELVAAEEGAARSGGDRREFDFTGPVRRTRLLLGAVLVFWTGFAVAYVVAEQTTDPLMWAFFALGIGVQLWWQWSLPRRLVRSAALDGDRLRARTVDGREHVAALADVDLSSEGWASRVNSAPTPLRIPGATLLLLRPAANELVDRLSTAGADR